MTGKWLQRCGAAFRVALASAIVGCSAFLSAPTGEADAAAGDRALKLYNIHTQKTETIVFKRNGQYDPAALKELNYFLRDWRRDLPTNMDPHLFDLIWQVYQESGSRDFIHVVCGYRSPPTNAMLRGRSRTTGVAEHSQHMLGKAMDFFIPDVPLAKLREIGLRMQVGGVGFYPTSGSPFVHMDTGSVRHWPRMTHDQLVRVFPNGHTLHIPSDGRPLPGYEEALADYRARKASGGTIMMASAQPKKSWFGRLLGGKSDDGEDEDGIPDAKAADAQARAADAQPAVAAQPAAPDVQLAAPGTAIETAFAPLPRPSPSRIAAPIEVADASTDDDTSLPPMPRPSPTARPMVTLASAADIIPLPRSKNAISDQLAALDAKSEAEAAQADNELAPPTPRSAADAIAAQVGALRRGTDSPVLAYAAPLSDDPGAPHIDANSGALVGGHPAGLRGTSVADGSWNDPLAQLSPVSYSTATLELITRTGSTRQKGYADFRMPQPFARSSLFSAPEGTVTLGFGRIAYEGLRTDRFAGPFVRQLATQQFASISIDYRRTASLSH